MRYRVDEVKKWNPMHVNWSASHYRRWQVMNVPFNGDGLCLAKALHAKNKHNMVLHCSFPDWYRPDNGCCNATAIMRLSDNAAPSIRGLAVVVVLHSFFASFILHLCATITSSQTVDLNALSTKKNKKEASCIYDLIFENINGPNRISRRSSSMENAFQTRKDTQHDTFSYFLTVFSFVHSEIRITFFFEREADPNT